MNKIKYLLKTSVYFKLINTNVEMMKKLVS